MVSRGRWWPGATPEPNTLSVATKFLSISVLIAIIPGGPGLALTGMSQFMDFVGANHMEVVVTTGAIM